MGVGLVLLASMAAGVMVLGQGGPSRPVGRQPETTTSTASAAPPGSKAVLAAGRWKVLPDAPLPPGAPIGHRRSMVSAWSGREFLVWGGSTAVGSGPDVLRGDGAGYDPGIDRWRLLPPAPLPPTTQATAVWSGGELIVWGGLDGGPASVTAAGAAYNPTTDTWRTIAPSPLAPRSAPFSVWTGREMIILGGYPRLTQNNTLDKFGDAAAYDPTRDSWRRLPPLPLSSGHDQQYPIALWTDSRLLLWWPWIHHEPKGDGFTETIGIDFFRYTPDTDRWDLAPPARNGPAGIGQPFWTGRHVITAPVPSYRGSAGGGATALVPPQRYDPADNSWTAFPSGPDQGGPTVWTGNVLLTVIGQPVPGRPPCGQGGTCDPASDFQSTLWACDPDTGTWAQLPTAPITMPPPPFDVATVWTGKELLLWGTATHRPLMENGRRGLLETRAVGMRFGP